MDDRTESATEQVLKRRFYAYIFLAFVLFLATAVVSNRMALEHTSWLQMDLAGSEPGNLDLDTERFLGRLDRPLAVTFFVSAKDRMPSHLKNVEAYVVRLLRALRAHAPQNIEYRVLDPDLDAPHGIAYAARRKASPITVKRVVHDETSEQTVWSSLVLALEGHQEVLIQGIGPAQLPHLEQLITHHLRAKLEPRRPTFGLSAPEQFQLLAHFLTEHGDLVRLDLEQQTNIPPEVDVLFWLQPAGITPAHIRQLKKFLGSGHTALLAGSSYSVGYEFAEAGTSYRAFRHPRAWELLLAPFGLRPLPDLLMDASTGPVPLYAGDGAVREVVAPFHIRCLPAFYNLKSFQGPARGGLNFVSASALEVNPVRAAEAGFLPEVIATTTGNTWVRALPQDPFSDTDLQPELKVPKQNLAVLLKPTDPLGGELLVLGSAALFQDGIINQPGYAHRVFLRTLLRTFSSADRLVQARIGRAVPDALPAVGPGARFWWRLGVVLLLPALLVTVIVRRHLPTRPPVGSGFSRWLTVRVGLSLAVLALGCLWWRQRGEFYLDVTASEAHSPAPLTRQQVSAAGPRAKLISSPGSALPTALKRAQKRARFLLRSLGVDLQTHRPEEMSTLELQRLGSRGLRPFETEIVREDSIFTESVWSGLSVGVGDKVEVIPRLDESTVEHLEFLLLAAMHRHHKGTGPQVAVVSDLPRLSPAEALEDYHKKSLIPPKGSDVYSDVKSLLRDYGYTVTHVDPRNPLLPMDAGVVIWLQPRRDATPILEQLGAYLSNGGHALIALQHFNIQQRQYRGTGFRTVYWPQPQFQDAEAYLNLLGIEQVREVLMDQTQHHLELETQVNRTAVREYDPQKVALPFLIRTVGANYAGDSAITRRLGDLLFVWGNRFAFDLDRLATYGLEHHVLISTSDRVWSFPWKGGWLPPQIFTPQEFLPGKQPLAVSIEGRFPPLVLEKDESRVEFGLGPLDRLQPAGKLALVGSSEMFKNGYLAAAGFQHDQLLLNLVAQLAFGPEMATLQARRSSPRGFAHQSSSAKIWWRVVVMGTAPLAFLALGMARYRRRRAPLRLA
uniref:ABC-type uncharacterized transport system domain-containing protein n=1 Tax=uncultured nuHF2 cluster bacterium HF0500_31B05 TaxID=723589 RepID=E7C5W9_9BACT|nr:hypothetical protein [uncultured nuHF2 cluster bacterium HF0500_31B05]